MKRYWTADQHLGGGNVIGYCDRPFRDCDHMNVRLIDGANERAKKDDMLVVVGDFMMKGGASKFKEWRDAYHSHTVFLLGNHCSNNGVKSVCSSMFTRISHFNVFVNHIPYFYTDWFDADLIAYVEKSCDFAICGHVHTAWKHFMGVNELGKAGIPCINVGVDVWKYLPVSDDELVNYYLKIKKGLV